jgi:hypothetical protein
MRALIVVTGISMATAGCARGLPDRVEDAAAMEAAVLRIAPPGTPIDEARRRVERAGFACEPTRVGPFAGEPDSLRYAYCDGSSRGDPFVSRRFQLALVDSAGLLSRVRATSHRVGP